MHPLPITLWIGRARADIDELNVVVVFRAARFINNLIANECNMFKILLKRVAEHCYFLASSLSAGLYCFTNFLAQAFVELIVAGVFFGVSIYVLYQQRTPQNRGV
jgi:hypothetical protein